MRESNNNDVDEYENTREHEFKQLSHHIDIAEFREKEVSLDDSQASIISFLTNSRISENGSNMFEMTPSPKGKRSSSQKRKEFNKDLADLLTPEGKSSN
jgi:hypothetical protein